jgi:uroporphyrinogen-III synthase
MTRSLLIVRPEPGASRTVALASERGFTSRSYPLYAVTAHDWTAPDPAEFDALLFTSANAARLGGQQLARYRHLPTFAVGEATARAARAAGCANVTVGTGGAQDVARLAAAKGHARLLHPCGVHVRAFDPGPLRIMRVCVYASVERGDATGLAAAIAPGMIALVHSPRAGQRLAALVPMRQRANLHLVAISPATLEAAGQGWASLAAAPTPDDKAMLALAAALCE